MSITVREMKPEEIVRIAEVNRSEQVKALYLAERQDDGFTLCLRREPKDPPISTPHWDEKGVKHRINLWRPELDKGGTMLGAFDEDRLAGFAILGPKRRDNSAQVAAMFVDSRYRRTGIGSLLKRELEKKAREAGITALYLYSNPTESSVNFYLKHGYKIISIVDKTLISHLPWDVVMAKELSRCLT